MLDFGVNFATFQPIKTSLQSSWSAKEGTLDQEDDDSDDSQAE